MKVYGAMYNHMTPESTATPVSLHKSKEGAQMVLDFHKQKIKQEHDEWLQEMLKDDPEFDDLGWDFLKEWYVEEFEVKE